MGRNFLNIKKRTLINKAGLLYFMKTYEEPEWNRLFSRKFLGKIPKMISVKCSLDISTTCMYVTHTHTHTQTHIHTHIYKILFMDFSVCFVDLLILILFEFLIFPENDFYRILGKKLSVCKLLKHKAYTILHRKVYKIFKDLKFLYLSLTAC